MAVIRLHDERLFAVNDAFARLTGHDRDRIAGARLRDVGALSASDLPALLERSHEGEVICDVELDLQVADETRRVVLLTLHSIPEQKPPCLLAMLTDVTRHKQVEEDLIRAKEKAEEMSRLKMAILTNITHEVRTPLTVILGFTSMLRKGVQEEYLRFVDLVERSGRRLMRMLDTMLDLARLEAGTLEIDTHPFDVVETVRTETEAFQKPAEEKGLAFQVHTPARRCNAYLDQDIFRRVLGNLLDNAIKFTDEGRIEVTVETETDEVFVRVHDTGIGIGAAFLPKIYDEFAQESTGLERTHQGAGLGLTVSRRLIEEAGGAIHVESDKGEGSLFTIVLPRHAASN